MPALRLLVASALPLVLLAVATAQEEATSVKQGTFFTLHCHGGDETTAERALAAIEPVWPAVANLVGKPGVQPKQPLPVHLYRTIAGYEAAERSLTGGTFARNLAMTHHASNSAHVAVQPPVSDETLRALGLPGLTAELLAWEATHLARRELLGTQGAHPMWLVDGLAADTARTVTRQMVAPAATSWPTQDTAILCVQRLAKEKKLPPALAILGDRIDELDMNERYAVRAVFYAFLRTERQAGALGKVLAAVRSTGGGKDYQDRVFAVAKANFGKQVDAEFAAYAAGLEGAWREVYRSLLPVAGGWQQIAFPDTNAIAWHQRPVAGGALRLAGTLRILPGDGKQMNVLFGRTEAGDFYSVAFVADAGFTFFSYRSKGDVWQPLGGGNAPSLRRGYTSTFELVARGRALHVQLDGQHWDFELPEALPQAVQWGLGAQSGHEGAATGTAGLWSNVSAKAP
jgi:hypothetical protein